MSRICPQCGREYFGQTVKCIHCNCALVEKTTASTPTRQAGRQTAAQINQRRMQQQMEAQERARQQQQLLLLEQEQRKAQGTKRKQSNSTLGTLSLVFSILGCTFLIGMILAIIDLCQKNGKKKTLSIISIVVCALWILISIGARNMSDTKIEKDNSSNVAINNEDELREIYNPEIESEPEYNFDQEPEEIPQEVSDEYPVESYEDSEPKTLDLSDELATFSSGEYLFITNDDLDKYHSNMGGVKVYVVTDIDDMKPNKIQSTLSGGYVMSNFDVGENYSKYESVLKDGDMVAIIGTVTGHDDYGFIGTSVDLHGCQVFAVGDTALSYLKNVSDSGLSQYFYVTEEAAETSDDVSESEYKSLCNSLSYEDIMRNPDGNKGKYCTVTGTVDQIIEGWFGSFSIFVVDYSGNKWGCVYSYKDGEYRLMEGDSVTIYGKCEGTDTTKTVLGQQVTMPRIDVEYIN